MVQDNEEIRPKEELIEIEGDCFIVRNISFFEKDIAVDFADDSENGVFYVLRINFKGRPYYKEYNFLTAEERDKVYKDIKIKLIGLGFIFM